MDILQFNFPTCCWLTFTLLAIFWHCKNAVRQILCFCIQLYKDTFLMEIFIVMLCASSTFLESMKLYSKVIIPLYLGGFPLVYLFTSNSYFQTYIYANLKHMKLTQFNLHFIHQHSVWASFPNIIDDSSFFFNEATLHSLCSFCLVSSFLYIGILLCAGY